MCKIIGMSDMPLEPDSLDMAAFTPDTYVSEVWQSDGGNHLEMMIVTACWPRADIDLAKVRFCAATDVICEMLEEAAVQVGCLLGDDARIHLLNQQFRGKDSATNVLSFPAFGFEDGGGPEGGETNSTAEVQILGEVAIARQTVIAEAQFEAKTLGNHLTHLWVHGVLHLFGFDHETDSDAAAMEELETAILATLGIANPYSEFSPVLKNSTDDNLGPDGTIKRITS